MHKSIYRSSEMNFDEHPKCFLETFQWVRDSIMGRFKEINKIVCPVARQSHYMDSMFISSFSASNCSRVDFIKEIRNLIGLFEEINNQSKKKSNVSSLIMIITDLQENQYYYWIDEVHSLLKPEFMRAGLMLGEFHSKSTIESPRVPGAFPLRSLHPLFVVRAMHRHDHLFIDRSGSVESRLVELELYIKTMMKQRSYHPSEEIKSRISELKRQLREEIL